MLAVAGCSDRDLVPAAPTEGVAIGVTPSVIDADIARHGASRTETETKEEDGVNVLRHYFTSGIVTTENFQKYGAINLRIAKSELNPDGTIYTFGHYWVNWFGDRNPLDKTAWELSDKEYSHDESDIRLVKWPTTGNLDFFALANCSVNHNWCNILYNNDTDENKIPGCKADTRWGVFNYRPVGYANDVKDKDNKDRIVGHDMLYAVTRGKNINSYSDGRVPLEFKHAMSCIEFVLDNTNPNTQIYIDNIDMHICREGVFTYEQSDTEGDYIQWHDSRLREYGRLSYGTGYYIMHPIMMRGNENRSYYARFLDKPVMENKKDATKRMGVDKEFEGKPFYYLIVPQTVKYSSKSFSNDGNAKVPVISLWARIWNINTKGGAPDCTSWPGMGARYNEVYDPSYENYETLYSGSRNSDVNINIEDQGNLIYVHVPLCPLDANGNGEFTFKPNTKYVMHITFGEGAGWQGSTQVLTPVVTKVEEIPWNNAEVWYNSFF